MFNLTKMPSSGDKSRIQSQFTSGSNDICAKRNVMIRLRDIYDPKPSPKAPVRIRPPSPRPPYNVTVPRECEDSMLHFT
ncbi:hypothetical protein KUCAC02_031018 [Chaenocephalus aceratus]|uniref:Uncharacterized protein n=1 Tax=Chaenocephalus aceratus TaxID=36190 RepID=A0ACB9XKH4_CHAAC|nr:hypothetical protein KUCAC02_031018 [Chaenocephalus aceratus]